MKKNREIIGIRIFLSVGILCSLVVISSLSVFPVRTNPQKDQDMELSFPETAGPNDFISIWNTSAPGVSNSSQVSLPLYIYGTYDFLVEWGDGKSNVITSWNNENKTHSYASSGIYTIIITGTIEGWVFKNGGDKLKILEIQQWGCLVLKENSGHFWGCENLALTATDNLYLGGTTSLSSTFKDCENLGSNGSMSGWDVSGVKSMWEMFGGASSFDQPLGNWDVSNVSTLNSMFKGASSFNQDIGDWNVSAVHNMHNTFEGASSFNQDIGDWNVSSADEMYEMFKGASSFDQPLGNWDVSSVTDMNSMFEGASSFNQPIGNWDVSGVTDMRFMFCSASSFNQDIGGWNVSGMVRMHHMFEGSSSFNQPIGNWDVSGVINMGSIFEGASSFNQPLGNWDVSNVYDMMRMFYGASSFDQPLGNWDVSTVDFMAYMFYGVTLSTENYDNLLIGWSQLELRPDVHFHAGYSRYSKDGKVARDLIVDTYSWVITDGGQTIPGYNLFIILGLMGLICIVIIKKQKSTQ